MRRVRLVHLIWGLAAALLQADVLSAQTIAPAAALAPAAGALAPPAAEAEQPAAPAAAADAPLRSLFDQTWRQFAIGGRYTNIDGDPARFQRYQDVRNGVLFTDFRYAYQQPEERWLFRVAADNVGWRDQKFVADYNSPGRFNLSGKWQGIPQFYSVDTATPYTRSDGALVLDDATQRSIQNGQANLSAWIPLAPKFELQERRDIGNVNFVVTPTPNIDLKASYTTNKHVGELPWGASFGFGNDVEVALPYDSRANDITFGAEWTNQRNMLNVSYTGSWFDNISDPLIWDSPLRVDDSTSAPGRGRMALWPSNSAQTVSVGGYTKLAKRTQLTGFLSVGSWTNDEPLQPFTINSMLTQLPLPRSSAEAEASVISTNLNLVSRPSNDWRMSARFRNYGYSNQTPQFSTDRFVSYDASVNTTTTGGPRLYAHNRTTFDADATWSGLQPIAVTFGYTRNNGGYDYRVFDSTGEDTFRLTADAVGSSWVTFRATYELSSRGGSGLNEDLQVANGEQPAMRHYDVANRSRNRFTGQMDVMPNDLWIFSASAGVGNDDYDDSYFGLQQSAFQTFSAGADYRQENGFGGGATYSYEHYSGDQRSRSASAGQTPPQETDPMRDWTVDSRERVNYFSLYVTPPAIGQNTEMRLSYDFSHALGSYLYAVVPGGPLPPPNQLPDVYNKLQQLHVDVRHRLSTRMVASVSYLYEPFRVYDFAFDQSVVNSIVQPSSLVMGYVYRPYTVNSFVMTLRYLW